MLKSRGVNDKIFASIDYILSCNLMFDALNNQVEDMLKQLENQNLYTKKSIF